MSYFGVSGPAQDGGFIAGIGAGAQRLNNARAARASYSKTLAGRVSSRLGATTEVVNTSKMDTISEFLNQYRPYIKWTSVVRLQKQEEKELILPFYISINDVSGIQVQTLIDNWMEDNYETFKAENPGQSDDNIEIYLKEAAKRYFKPTYVGMFEAAGYEKDDANSLAQSAINLHKDGVWGRIPVKSKELVYTRVWDPSEKEATFEATYNEGRPQNTTQYVVYGVGALAIAYFFATRTRMMKGSARKSAFYGVFG
jgi:hypothetical protein